MSKYRMERSEPFDAMKGISRNEKNGILFILSLVWIGIFLVLDRVFWRPHEEIFYFDDVNALEQERKALIGSTAKIGNWGNLTSRQKNNVVVSATLASYHKLNSTEIMTIMNEQIISGGWKILENTRPGAYASFCKSRYRLNLYKSTTGTISISYMVKQYKKDIEC